MKYNSMRILQVFIVLNSALSAQTTCEVWQFSGTDSANGKLAKTEIYNSRGQISYEKVDYLKLHAGASTGKFEYHYTYSDSLLTKKISVWDDGDSIRTEYFYDTAGTLTHQHIYNRAKSDSVPTGWIRDMEVFYTYDRWGRKILMESRSLQFASSVFLKWDYDEKGRVSRFSQYNDQLKLSYAYSYAYYEGGKKASLFYFDANEKARLKTKKKDPYYMRRRFFITKLDAQGRETEEKVTDRKNVRMERTATWYNDSGKIARRVFYDAKDVAVVTQVYSYK